MKMNLCLLATIFSAAFVFPTTKPAMADTYQAFALSSDQGILFYSMDNSGNVALLDLEGVIAPTYPTFHYGVPIAITTVAPTFIDDRGTPCVPAVPPGGSVLGGVCNNGRDAFTGSIVPPAVQTGPGLYAGSFPSITTIKPPSFGEGLIFMNSVGDIVIDDHYSDTWYFFLDTTADVPEPGSFLLFGTGALSLLAAIRRRFQEG